MIDKKCIYIVLEWMSIALHAGHQKGIKFIDIKIEIYICKYQRNENNCIDVTETNITELN